MSKSPAIELKNVSVVYNEGTPHECAALKDVSLTILSGETVIVTGGNGSGKSTLLRAIAGTAPIKSGKVLIYGRDVTSWPACRRAKLISSVYQDPVLGTCPNLTVYENFALAEARPWWLPIPDRFLLKQTHKNLILATGLPLDIKASSPASMLSGGQRQALAICLAFTTNHSIFLLDEFASSLASDTAAKVVPFVQKQLTEAGATAIMILHNNIDLIDKSKYRKVHFTEGKIRA